MKTDSLSNQLRWVVLLLAAAVILPTVCLLWFMNQAVKNERLAVRSKLSSVYRGEVSRVFSPLLEWVNSENQKARTALFQNSPYDVFRELAGIETDFESEGLFIYDQTAQTILYPALWDDYEAFETPPELEEAARLEFIEHSPEAALDEYERIVKDDFSDYMETGKIGKDPVIFKLCELGQARLWQKLGNTELAIMSCENIQREPLNRKIDWYLYTTANLKILDLLKIQGISKGKQAERLYERLDNLLHVIEKKELVSSEQRILAFDKVQSFSEQYANFIPQSTKRRIENLQSRIELERKSVGFISEHPDFIGPMHTGPLLEKIPETNLYAVNLYAGSLRAVRVVDIEQIVHDLSTELNFSDDIHCRILNADNDVITGPASVSNSPFLTFPIAPFLDWTVEFYETDANANIFENAAKRQTSIYLWTGALVALLVLSTGVVSIRAVNQQMKMNRLKNDFIATVTHELKTPLSSMRLLVDTLLEGRYEDEKTVPEYLGLIASENKRLSHLIDSFLTFSRMERNKQVFEMAPVSPVEIAKQAADAMQTKFDRDHVCFDLDIPKSLPMIRADKDGLITVLVNLLDNACKYTMNDKQITLTVYQQNGDLCFAIKDNGIGLSKRAQKRIFNRFYQVDSRLSRSVEGCGLGLSIVKFIVDAHKGTIEVDSQLGQGSTFTVKLPKT